MKSVYILTDGTNYKIGVSKNPADRLESLNIGNGNKLTLMYCSQKLQNAFELERLIHKHYSEKKISNNEWFLFDDVNSVVAYVDNLIAEKGNSQPKNDSNDYSLILETLSKFYDTSKRADYIHRCYLEEREKNNMSISFLKYIQFGIECELSTFMYETIFNKTLDELKKEFGVKPKESIRDYLTSEQLKEVEAMEMLISSLISLGMGYQEIKEFIKQKYTLSLTA